MDFAIRKLAEERSTVTNITKELHVAIIFLWGKRISLLLVNVTFRYNVEGLELRFYFISFILQVPDINENASHAHY